MSRFIRSTSLSTLRAISAVLVPDCLFTLRRTPLRPSMRTVRISFFQESATSAISARRTGAPSWTAMTVSRISSIDLNVPSVRTVTSKRPR